MKHHQHGHGTTGHKHHTAPLYDTEVPTPTHAERARTLMEQIGTGCLSTAAVEMKGHPYGSFITYALEDGHPIFLISALAEHTKNLLTEPRCSLMVVEPGTGDPLARGRVTLVGHATELEKGRASESARSAFLAAHPGASYYMDYGDFRFWRVEIESVRYIGGYGRMSWVEGDDWTGASPDPIAAHADHIVAHMNADHLDTMALYCKAFTKAQEFSEVTMIGIDRYGFEMSVQTDKGPRPIRLPFSATVSTPDEAREALVDLAKRARIQLG